MEPEILIERATALNKIELNGGEPHIWSVRHMATTRKGNKRLATWTYRTEAGARRKYLEMLENISKWDESVRGTVHLVRADLVWVEVA